jgi:hypothetical protein
LRCLGYQPGDEVTDVFPGTGIMGRTVESMESQLAFDLAPAKWNARSYKGRINQWRRVAEPLPGMVAPTYQHETRRNVAGIDNAATLDNTRHA